MSTPQRFLALAALVTLTACAGPDPAATAPAGPPRPGGTLSVGLPSDPGCLDPQQTQQLTAADVSRSLVDSLTDQDPATGKIVPWLAESWTVSADAKDFTFVLRAGPTFSDGSPVDAEAAKSTFDKLVQLPANGAAAYIRGYTGTTITDTRTFTVHFDTSNAQFLQATAGAGLGILSRATAGVPLADRCRGSFVGSGAFVLDHYTANQEVVIRKRDGYAWPSSIATNPGAAYLDQVRYLFIPEAGARSGALASRQIHVAENVQATDQAQFDGNGFHLLVTPGPGIAPPLSLNHVGVLADQRIRMALLKGINRTELAQNVFGERGKPATGVLASTTPFYVDQSDQLRFDPDGAKALLDEAGWVPGPDGIRVKDGARLTLNWLIPAPMPVANEHVQQQLRRIGVDVRLNAVAPPKYVEQQSAGAFDLTAVATTRADPDVLRNLFLSSGQNLWHLPPSELDTYLRQQLSATTDEARQEAVTKAVRWILDHADTVPLYENMFVHGVASDVQNLRTDASTRLGLHDAWITG